MSHTPRKDTAPVQDNYYYSVRTYRAGWYLGFGSVAVALPVSNWLWSDRVLTPLLSWGGFVVLVFLLGVYIWTDRGSCKKELGRGLLRGAVLAVPLCGLGILAMLMLRRWHEPLLGMLESNERRIQNWLQEPEEVAQRPEVERKLVLAFPDSATPPNQHDTPPASVERTPATDLNDAHSLAESTDFNRLLELEKKQAALSKAEAETEEEEFQAFLQEENMRQMTQTNELTTQSALLKTKAQEAQQVWYASHYELQEARYRREQTELEMKNTQRRIEYAQHQLQRAQQNKDLKLQEFWKQEQARNQARLRELHVGMKTLHAQVQAAEQAVHAAQALMQAQHHALVQTQIPPNSNQRSIFVLHDGSRIPVERSVDFGDTWSVKTTTGRFLAISKARVARIEAP